MMQPIAQRLQVLVLSTLPVIETNRLCLRPLAQTDFESLCLLDGDPIVRSFFPEGVLNPNQIQQELQRHLLNWQNKGFGIFAMIHRDTQTFIGRCGFNQLHSGTIELGYLLLPAYWGQGYATEAAKAVLNWGLGCLPADEIVGFAPTAHAASKRVLEKCGMVFDHFGAYRDVPCTFYKVVLTPVR
jgi:ribosomal-protein-alanine N-acetyltransferase